MASKAKTVPLKGQKQEKKLTNAQLEGRIKNAIVFVPKDKETKSVYFSDKGLRVTITMDCAVIATGFHQHVFASFTTSGVSRPYLYAQRLVDIALENDCVDENAKGNKFYSYTKLFRTLEEKEDKTQYNLCMYIDWWLYNTFSPLFEIDETGAGQFLVYERYMHNIARQSFLLDEHKEDVTNKSFIDAILEREKSFIEGMEESVILKAKSDEERMQEEVDSMQEQEQEAQITE